MNSENRWKTRCALQPCQACYDDTQAVGGACRLACPSGSLQQAPLSPYVAASFEFAATVNDYNHSGLQAARGLSTGTSKIQKSAQAEARQAGLDARSFRTWLSEKGSKATGKFHSQTCRHAHPFVASSVCRSIRGRSSHLELGTS